MGIRLLNKFINKKCNYNQNNDNDCIRKVHLSKLRNRKICVDINVYLYDYLCQDKLKINMLTMCNVFNQYNIVPLFVFDGKPPQIKKDEIIYFSLGYVDFKDISLVYKNNQNPYSTNGW